MIIVENKVNVSDVEQYLEHAELNFAALSKTLSKDEITTVVENISKNDPLLAIAIGSLNENIQLNEFLVKHVSSKGEVDKKQDLKTRKRKAFQVTGLSKAARRQIARKAAKTKKANPSKQKIAVKKTQKAMKKRKSLGLS